MKKVHNFFRKRKQLFISLGIILFLVIGTILVILYGKGYRFSPDRGIAGTGLLVTTSIPNGASVYIDGHLTTATDNTINLAPGWYTIKIAKDGYFPWEKKIHVQAEIVAKAEALLFPTAPKLESITSSGAQNPLIDPSHTRIAYIVASQSARKNGIYVLAMNANPLLAFQGAATQIADDTVDIFTNSTYKWSPDSQEILATIPSETSETTYLLKTNTFNQAPVDVTATLQATQNAWEKDQLEKEKARLATIKKPVRSMLTKNFTIFAWSPDNLKILYQASESATLPIIIKPRLVGTNNTPEERNIQKDKLYVYDILEDRNYQIDLPQPEEQKNTSFNWLPDSKHLVWVHNKKIDIMEYDGTNITTVYAGPFDPQYVFPWATGTKIVILTNLENALSSPNLYTIELR